MRQTSSTAAAGCTSRHPSSSRKAASRCSPACSSFATRSSKHTAVNVWKQRKLCNLQNRVDENALGFKFEEWDSTENVDSSQMPAVMMIKWSELRAAGFTLREVFSPELEAAARRRYMHGAGIRQLEGMGPKGFMQSVDDDTESGSRFKWMCICVLWHDFSKKMISKNVITSPKKNCARTPRPQMCSHKCVVLAHSDRVLSPWFICCCDLSRVA